MNFSFSCLFLASLLPLITRGALQEVMPSLCHKCYWLQKQMSKTETKLMNICRVTAFRNEARLHVIMILTCSVCLYLYVTTALPSPLDTRQTLQLVSGGFRRQHVKNPVFMFHLLWNFLHIIQSAVIIAATHAIVLYVAIGLETYWFTPTSVYLTAFSLHSPVDQRVMWIRTQAQWSTYQLL